MVIEILDDDNEEYDVEDNAIMFEARAKEKPKIKIMADNKLNDAHKTSMVKPRQEEPRRSQCNHRAPARYEDYY